jgi:hypothetical protein
VKLAWHIAWKDLRRLRVIIALWTVLIAAKPVVGALLLQGWGAHWFEALRGANYALSGLELVATYFLVAAFVHEDVVVGSTAFWITRPVSGLTLFGAKIFGLAVVFGALPLVINVAWWFACRYGAREILLASLETLAVPGCVAVVALPLASLTDGTKRFLLTTLVLATGTIFLLSNHVAIQTGPIATLMGLIVFLGVGLLAAIHQYWSRRFIRSMGILGVGLALAVLVSSTKFPLTLPRATISDTPGREAASIELALRDVRAWGTSRPDSVLSVGLGVHGTSPEVTLRGSTTHRWDWKDELSLQRNGDWSEFNFRDFDVGADLLALGLKVPRATPEELERIRERRALVNTNRAQRGLAPLPKSDQELGINVWTGVLVPTALISRIRRDPPEYLLRARLQVLRPVVLGEKPARKGEKIAAGPEVTRVARTEIRYVYRNSRGGAWNSSSPVDGGITEGVIVGNRLNITLVEHLPTTWEKATESGFGPFLFSNWPERAYFLINRSKGTASASDYRESSRRTVAVRVATVGIAWRMLELEVPAGVVATDRTSATELVEGLTLAKLKLREEERFTKELHVPRFEISSRETGGVP